MKPTDISAPDYFHKVVDCQWACPAHTPVPEYIRLIAEGRYSDAYMINWKSNVFPGILGRTCDRPCEPACRRGRVEETPGRDLPPEARRRRLQGRRQASHAQARLAKNGKRIALVGGGSRFAHGGARSRPARLSLHRVRRRCQGRRHDAHADPEIPPARIRDRRGNRLHPQPRRRVQERPAHRQPEEAARPRTTTRSSSARGAPRGRELDIPGRKEAAKPTSISASSGWPRSRSATSTRSAAASSCSAAATPRWIAAAPPAAWAATRSR